MQLKIIKHIGIWLLASLLTLIVASKEGLISWIVTYIWFGIGGIVGGSIGVIVLYLEMKYRSDFPENLEETGRLIKLILLLAFSSFLFSIFRDGGFSMLRNSLGFFSWVFAAHLSRSCIIDVCPKDTFCEILREKKKKVLYPAIAIMVMSNPMYVMMKIAENLMLND